jgi:hypothetical protein
VRIRVPRRAAFAAALVLSVLIPFSYCAYTRFRRMVAHDPPVGLHVILENADGSADPRALLAEANRLYWLNNGTKAAPLYAKTDYETGCPTRIQESVWSDKNRAHRHQPCTT